MWRTKGASSLYAEEINIYLKYFLDRYKLGYIRMYQEKFGKLAPGSEEEKILWELCSWFDRLPAEQEGES